MKIDWFFIYNLNNMDIGDIRNTKTKIKYFFFKLYLKLRCMTIAQYINNKYFHNKQNQWVLVPNDFPYDLENNILHYVLWFNPSIGGSLELAKIICEEHIAMDVRFTDYFIFENPEHKKSVPEILHYQVFFRKYNNIMNI